MTNDLTYAKPQVEFGAKSLCDSRLAGRLRYRAALLRGLRILTVAVGLLVAAPLWAARVDPQDPETEMAGAGSCIAFDSATWEGYWWNRNVPQGTWFPTVSAGSAVFTQDDYSVMQLRTISRDFAGRDVTVTFVPRLNSGGVNGDGANIGFGTDWAGYPGPPNGSGEPFAGLQVSQGIVRLAANFGSSSTAGPTLRTYTPGETITITLRYSGGQVTASGVGITTTSWSSGTNLVNPRFVLLGSNSTDGISFSCVAVAPTGGSCLAFDSATWEGYWWNRNVPQGTWFPTVSAGSAVFTQDDYSVMQLRTLSRDFAGRDVTVTFVPRLNSGGVNGDGANIGFGTDWAGYPGPPNGSGEPFAGILVSQGTIRLAANFGSTSTTGPTLRTYTPGETITITLRYSGGQVTASGAGITTTSWSSGTNLVNPRFVLLGSNSTDGISFSCVAASAAITRLKNISTRAKVEVGDNIMIGGFIVGGTAPKRVVITGRGPSMASLGVPGTLSDPAIRLYSGSTPVEFNDNWQSASNAAEISASTFAPTNPQEAAILATVAPGVPYTVHVTGVGSTTGIAIVEVFELDAPENPLLNISTRGKVQTDDDVMIGGFIIQGSASQQVLITARGPALATLGVPGVLADPTLDLYAAGNPNPIATNDNWVDSPDAAAIGADKDRPTNSLESAILRTLAPGAYTAIVRGKNGGVGIGIVEVFRK